MRCVDLEWEMGDLTLYPRDPVSPDVLAHVGLRYANPIYKAKLFEFLHLEFRQ